jgi:alpha-1,3-mannosyltransferase
MIVGRYWLYKLRYLHFSITSMILGYSFSGECLIISLTPNSLLSVSVFSAALSVKMSILLYLPGLLVILFKRRGLLLTLGYMVILVMTQIFFAVPFLMEDARAYAHSAFNLGRVFLYKWTVNWRFIEEDVFLSSRFAITLLVGHATVLILFGLFKWCELDGGVYRVLSRGIRRPLHPPALDKVDADCEHIYSVISRAKRDSIDVATVLFTSNLIGILFSRSLHYQFYSWYAQQIPFLAWRTRYPLPVK